MILYFLFDVFNVINIFAFSQLENRAGEGLKKISLIHIQQIYAAVEYFRHKTILNT